MIENYCVPWIILKLYFIEKFNIYNYPVNFNGLSALKFYACFFRKKTLRGVATKIKGK